MQHVTEIIVLAIRTHKNAMHAILVHLWEAKSRRYERTIEILVIPSVKLSKI